MCAHKQQYIAVEAKKHFLWEDEIHPFKIPEYPYILECIQVWIISSKETIIKYV